MYIFKSAATRLAWTSLVVFGDSLSDNGNGSYALTNHTWPADPAYFNGRFSNGLVWVEHLQEMLAIPRIEDHAYGGATINNSRITGYTGYNSTTMVPSTTDQVAEYLQKESGSNHHDKLFLISGGNNDAFFLKPDQDATALAYSVAKDLLAASRAIYHAGGRHFIIPTNSCIQKTPYTLTYASSTVTSLNTFRRAFSQYIEKHAKSTLPSDAHVIIFRSCLHLNNIIQQPEKFGFTNTTGACLKGAYPAEAPTRSLCDNADEYIFWDVFHPTTKTHRLLAQDAHNVIKYGKGRW